MKFRDKLIRFMYGRYGADELYRFMTILFFVLWAVNLFVGSIVIYVLMLCVLALQLFRVFSRNINARRRENAVYLRLKSRVKSFFSGIGMRLRDIRTHRYRKCHKCGATLRLPNRKGTHTAKCPRCGNEFKVKITL